MENAHVTIQNISADEYWVLQKSNLLILFAGTFQQLPGSDRDKQSTTSPYLS